MHELARRRLELALACVRTPRPATVYAVFGYERQLDLLITWHPPVPGPFRTSRLRFVVYADESMEIAEDVYLQLCASHDRRMDERYLGCPPGWRGEGGRCGDLLLQGLVAVFDAATVELLRG